MGSVTDGSGREADPLIMGEVAGPPAYLNGA